tara:strand:+ start:65 stop:307 length:243 start_codon:yes stop_codon:yes gene_type:complete
MANAKTGETNAQVAERMSNAYDLMVEANNNQPTVAEPLVSKEERKVILNSIAKVAGKGTGEQLVNYVDQVSTGLNALKNN